MKVNVFKRGLLRSRFLRLIMVTAGLTALLGLQTPVSLLSSAIAITTSDDISLSQHGQSPFYLTSAQQLLQQGREHYRAEQFTQAANLWLEAEKRFSIQRDGLNQVLALNNLALAYRQLGQWSEAESAIGKSLEILQNINPLTTEGLRLYGQALNTQGSLYLTQGHTQKALEIWEQTADIYTQANYSEGVVKSLLNQTHALRRLGFLLESRSRLSQVEALIEAQDNISLKVALTRTVGDHQRLLGEFKASQASLDKSLQLAEEFAVDKELAATQLSVGNTLHVRAQQQETFARRTRNKTDQAKADILYQQALDSYAAISVQAPLLVQTQALLNQFDISLHRKGWSRANSIQTSLLSKLDALPSGRTSAFIHMRLARLLMDKCTNACLAEITIPQQQIYSLLWKTKQQAEAIRDPVAVSYALGYLGHLYEIEEQYVDAQKLTEAALKQGHHQPSLIYQWEWQLGRIENKLEFTRERVLSHYDVAFQKVQAVRNDLLYVGPDIQFFFRDRIEPLYREYISLLLPKEEIAISDNTAQLLRAQTVIDDLRVAELESFLACGLIAPDDNIQRTTIQDVANTDKTTAIIYPIILPDEPGGDRIEVLLQLPDKAPDQTIQRYSPKVSQTGLSHTQNTDSPEQRSSKVKAKLEQFRHELERTYNYVLSQPGQRLANEIYDWLIRPAEEQGWLESIDTLVFVLDGAFRNVPMAALYDQQTKQFLIEKYAIAVTFGDLAIPQAPPAQSFSIFTGGLSSASSLPIAPEKSITSNSNAPESTMYFHALAFVEDELEAIQNIMGETENLLNLEFKKSSVQTKMRSSTHNIIHFATHGVFGFTRDDTYLLVAASEQPTENRAEQKGQAIEVEKMDLNDFDRLLRTRNQTPLELLVLSACETATGDSREVLGIAGLAVQSGARSTVASLWSINDFSTAELIKDFYEQLVNPDISKAKALQQAQVNLIRQNIRPSYWAPYLLVGDWR
ncbi:CHAT domain-containing protein [Leptolyngbyaceae cyanobacterium CCMR0082]|uniref:CHAT domain-containing protein n=2 Tax=Adonisia TaxID=2950183 RepID=A0A6M0SBW9_9CYAN|nr:CHAT domain-containing protein [Adonisia turfae CCMR0082]